MEEHIRADLINIDTSSGNMEFMFVIMDKMLSRAAIATFVANSLFRAFNGARNMMMQANETQFLDTNVVDAQNGISMSARFKQIERIAWA